MELDIKNGKMGKNILENLKKEKKMEMAKRHGRMVKFMKEDLNQVLNMEKENASLKKEAYI